MKMLPLTALLSALILTLTWSGAGAAVFTLKEALAVAYDTNPQLAAERANLRATDEEVSLANAAWHPTASVTGSYGYGTSQASGFIGNSIDHPVDGQATVTQPVFRGDTIANISKAKAEVRAERAQLVAMEEEVLLNAVTAYTSVLHDSAALDLRRKNVSDLEGAVEDTHAQVVIGTLTKTDEAQVRASLAAARTALAAAESQLGISRSRFEHIVGRPAETLETAPALPTLPATVDDAVKTAVKQNPALIAAQETVRAADYAVDSAVGALLPQVSIEGEYQYSRDNPSSPFANLSTNQYTAVLGQITVPIYQGGSEYATIRQNKELRSKSELTADETYRQADDTTREAWQNVLAAQSATADGHAEVAASQLAFDGVMEEFRIGERTVLDTLIARQALVTAQLSVVDATFNSYVSAYQLLSAMGLLTAQQQGLNVTPYDPLEHYDEDAGSWIGFGD
jgi:outer membrane protein